MSAMRVFVLVSASVGLLVSAVLMLYLALSPQAPFNILYDKDKVATGAAAIGLIVGAIGTFAGAIASIQIAGLGLNISRTQERLAAVSFLEDRFARATAIYSDIGLCVSELYAACTALDGRLPTFDRSKVIAMMDQPIDPSLTNEYLLCQSAMDSLYAAMRALAADEFAYSCFAAGLAGKHEQLKALTQTLVAGGEPPLGAFASVESLVDLAQFLRVAKLKLQDGTWGPVLTARLTANSADIDLFGKAYDNRSVRAIFFAGNLIFARTDHFADGRLFIASYGAAMIHDLARCLPATADIKAALQASYPHLASHVDSVFSTFTPDTIVSRNLQSALADADSIGGLYALVQQG